MHSGTRPSKAAKVDVTEDGVTVWLDDGRTISTPLAWYPRLVHATDAERQNFRIIAGGEGLHWPDLDEDLSIAGMLAGQPSREGPESLARWLKARGKSAA
jgi:hypothetical protein